MLLLAPVMLAGLLALLCGGSLQRFAELPVRNLSLILGSLAIQLAVYLPFLRRTPLVVGHAEIIYLGALTLSILGMLRNWRLGPPLRIATCGLLLNATVIAANGARMPVNAAALRATLGTQTVLMAQNPQIYGNTRPATRSSRLLLLSDVIPVKVPGYGGNVYSIGDVLITSGIALLVFRTMTRRAELTSRSNLSEQTKAS